jgi:predicted ThiF/HesA family dinucleotide-utilizing enzyme
VGNVAELQNPKAGDGLTSACGIIKVTLNHDGSLLVSVLSTKRGSFNIQVYYEGKAEPDTVVFRTDDPRVPAYRVDTGRRLTKIRVLTNPV